MVINRSRHRRLSPPVALLAEVLKLVEYRDHTAATLFVAWRKDRRNNGLDRRIPPLTVAGTDISKDDIRRLARIGRLKMLILRNLSARFGRLLATFRAVHETWSIDADKQVRGLVDAVEAVYQAKRDAQAKRNATS